ncbi:MAG: hypothetical protein ACTSVC_10310 [Promethearchaeota archaeon]
MKSTRNLKNLFVIVDDSKKGVQIYDEETIKYFVEPGILKKIKYLRELGIDYFPNLNYMF